MKNVIVWLFLLLILPGCSKNSSIPFEVSIVETVEAKEINDITHQVKHSLQAKDYDSLDQYAGKLRDSKECYANGTWKLWWVYNGLDLSEETSEAEWEAHVADLRDWIDARPDSITARVALANSLVTYAWKVRGGSVADQVTDEGWRLFEKRLNESVKVLNEAKLLKEQCPIWWSVLLRTDMGLAVDRSQYDATFEEATRFSPDYANYYGIRAYYLLPRWYGVNGEWESDLENSANRIGGDEGDLLYARVVWYMHQTRFYDNIIKDCGLSWRRADRGFKVMEKRFPNSLAAKSERAYLATLAGDLAYVRQDFDELDGNEDLTVWHKQATFLYCANWAYTYGIK